MTGRPNHFRSAGYRGGFTLIELVVVVGIIILLVAIAVPSVGPALSSNHQMQAIQLLTNAINIAQVRADKGGYIVRIERAFKTDAGGYMIDANGLRPYETGFTTPAYLDHQQIRLVRPPREVPYYAPAFDEPISLPKNAWLAPDYATLSMFNTAYFNSDQVWPAGGTYQGLKYNPFENFCIALDKRGHVAPLRPYNLAVTPPPNVVAQSDNYRYHDQTQMDANTGLSPVIDYLYPSARGVIVYDRKQFEQFGTNTTAKYDMLARDGRPLFVNRFLGTLVEGRTQ